MFINSKKKLSIPSSQNQFQQIPISLCILFNNSEQLITTFKSLLHNAELIVVYVILIPSSYFLLKYNIV